MDLLEFYILGEGYVHYDIIDILENLDGIIVWNGLGMAVVKSQKRVAETTGPCGIQAGLV